MSAASSTDSPKRTMRRDDETTKFWAKIKRYHGDENFPKDTDKIQAVLTFLIKKFNEEPRLSSTVKQDLFAELEPLVAEGLRIMDEAEANQRSSRGQGVTGYLDRVQTVLESRYH
ncbi:hypothetical protein BG015_008507 [Linnemannia schmuckeri]|uniref:Uncharacterized protein n=1 Tax=Linnemannia schmuckeri TaxID=64567 RepID=A0A9P5SAX5_9FUNG|nr:hypothetical protein BG015_008507 [Linnemannia schmuckeri]